MSADQRSQGKREFEKRVSQMRANLKAKQQAESDRLTKDHEDELIAIQERTNGKKSSKAKVTDNPVTTHKLASFFGLIVKEGEPRDGDGDGLVFDGTDQERPKGNIGEQQITDETLMSSRFESPPKNMDELKERTHVDMLHGTTYQRLEKMFERGGSRQGERGGFFASFDFEHAMQYPEFPDDGEEPIVISIRVPVQDLSYDPNDFQAEDPNNIDPEYLLSQSLFGRNPSAADVGRIDFSQITGVYDSSLEDPWNAGQLGHEMAKAILENIAKKDGSVTKSLSEFFGFTKESDCGANAPGGGGFQPGNSCGDDEGDGENDDDDNWHPDKDAPLPDDGPSQHRDMLHNIKTDPTKGDRAELLQFAKDVATFKIRKDSLLRRAIKELTTDPTNEDRGRAFQLVGDTLKLKPVAEFVTGKNRKENPASDDLAIITGGVKKVVNGTVGNLFRLIGRGAKASMGTGEALPDGLLNRVMSRPSSGFVRGFTKASEADQQDIVEQVTDEVMRRVGKDPSAAKVQEAILDVMEIVLAGDWPGEQEPDVQKASGISGTTGESGGFVQSSDEFADRDSDWLNHELDLDEDGTEVVTRSMSEFFGFTKATEPKDGDGDGFVYDGTDQERPVSKSPITMSTKEIMARYENAKTLGDVRRLIESILTGSNGVYFRAGDIPDGGQSYNHAEGHYEQGVSVWPTPWAQSLAGMGRSKWIAIRGTEIAKGSDGEPVVSVEDSIVFYDGEKNISNSEEAFIVEYCKRGSKLRKWIEDSK